MSYADCIVEYLRFLFFMYLEQSTECSRVWCRDADSLACDSMLRRAASDMWFVQSWDLDSLEKFSLSMCWKIHATIIIVVVHLADFVPAHAAPYARRTQTPNEVVVCVETPREGIPSWGVSNSEQERRRLKWKRKSINAQDINYVWKKTSQAWGRRGVKPWRLFSLIFFHLMTHLQKSNFPQRYLSNRWIVFRLHETLHRHQIASLTISTFIDDAIGSFA